MTGGTPPLVTVAVTDHAVERYRQRVSGGSGAVDVRPQIVARLRRAWEAGRRSEQAPDGSPARRGTLFVADADRRDLVFVCRWDRPNAEVLVVTLWEHGDAAAVPRQFTDELRRMDRRGALRRREASD